MYIWEHTFLKDDLTHYCNLTFVKNEAIKAKTKVGQLVNITCLLLVIWTIMDYS